MSHPIVPEGGLDVAATLDGWTQRMPLREAEDRYGLEHGELRGAIERGEISYYTAGKTQFRVSPAFVAEYIQAYRTHRNEQIPSC